MSATPPAAVTVVTLTCNRTQFFAEAVASVRAQEFAGWRLVVSDTSTDASARTAIRGVVEAAAREDARISWREQPPGLSQVQQLARVLPALDTPFIALLDDDDGWLPHHLGRAVEWLAADPLNGLTVANSIRIDEAGRQLGVSHPVDRVPFPPEAGSAWLRHLLSTWYSSTSAYVFRKEVLVHHRFRDTSCVDTHLAVRTLLHGMRLKVFPEPSMLYRIHPGSHYQKGDRTFLDRHRLRVWLMATEGLAITRRVPRFPLLAARSVLALAGARLRRPAGLAHAL